MIRGSEPDVEEAVQLIRETGGVAVLAHPWALKNPVGVIRRLKEAGLHGIEVYRRDGKLAGLSIMSFLFMKQYIFCSLSNSIIYFFLS